MAISSSMQIPGRTALALCLLPLPTCLLTWHSAHCSFLMEERMANLDGLDKSQRPNTRASYKGQMKKFYVSSRGGRWMLGGFVAGGDDWMRTDTVPSTLQPSTVVSAVR